MASVYEINKGINNPIQFKGIKAQFITYLVIAFVALLLAFAILYIIGLNIYLCLAIVAPAGIVSVMYIQRLSHKYGAHGLLKKSAYNQLPKVIYSQSTQLFQFKQKPSQS